MGAGGGGVGGGVDGPVPLPNNEKARFSNPFKNSFITTSHLIGLDPSLVLEEKRPLGL